MLTQRTNVIDIRTDGQTDDVTWQYYPYVAQKPVVAYELTVYYFNFDKSHKCKKVIHRTLKLHLL